MCYGQGCRVLLGMGDFQPLIGNPYNGYIKPYHKVDDHPMLYGKNGSLDPSTYRSYRLTGYTGHMTPQWGAYDDVTW